MGAQRTGSAKKNLPYHNTLILQKSKNLTVKDQLWLHRPFPDATKIRGIFLSSTFRKRARLRLNRVPWRQHSGAGGKT